MFTGLVQATGKIKRWQQETGELTITVTASFLATLNLGDSISVNGVCLTVTDVTTTELDAFVAAETVRCTNFATLDTGGVVNLEKCLTLQAPLGGHIVTGHIDGVVTLSAMEQEGESWLLHLHAEPKLLPFIAHKGSVALNGISLTVASVTTPSFTVMIIPHTWSNTNLSQVAVGDTLNIEVDILARYCQKLLSSQSTEADGTLPII